MTSSSQDFKIPNMEFETILDSTNSFVKLLNIKDANSLIIAIGTSNFETKVAISRFVVFNNDGSIMKFEVTFSKNANKKPKVKSKSLAKNKFEIYWNYLYHSLDQNKFNIDQKKLNTANGHSKLSLKITQNKRSTNYYNLRDKRLYGNDIDLNDQQMKLLKMVREISDLYNSY